MPDDNLDGAALEDLDRRLAAALVPDRNLDFWIWWHFRSSYGRRGETPPAPAADYIASTLSERPGLPRYTADLRPTIDLVPPACGFVLGRGRVRPGEPLHGALICALTDPNQVFGQGEHDLLTIAICRALISHRRRDRGDAVEASA